MRPYGIRPYSTAGRGITHQAMAVPGCVRLWLEDWVRGTSQRSRTRNSLPLRSGIPGLNPESVSPGPVFNLRRTREAFPLNPVLAKPLQ